MGHLKSLDQRKNRHMSIQFFKCLKRNLCIVQQKAEIFYLDIKYYFYRKKL